VYSLKSASYQKDSFVIFGGETSSNSLSNELWLYNATLNKWKLLSSSSNIPGLVGHILVNAGTKLFVIGGKLTMKRPRNFVWLNREK